MDAPPVSSGGDDHKDMMDRGLGLRRALSDETQSRPFQPLGGEVLHIGWLRTESDGGKVTRAEGSNDRECLESLLEHYTVGKEEQEELLDRVERGWSDVTFTLGEGYYCRLQRFSEFDTLTLSGPGDTEQAPAAPLRPWQWLLPENWLTRVPGRVFLCAHVVVRHPDEKHTKLLDDTDLWNELQDVTNAIGWERKVEANGGVPHTADTVHGTAREEALAAIAEITAKEGGGINDDEEEEEEEEEEAAAGRKKNGTGMFDGAVGQPVGSGRIRMVSTGALSLELDENGRRVGGGGGSGVATATVVARPGEEEEEEEEEEIIKKKETTKTKRRKNIIKKDIHKKVKKATAAFGTEEWQREQKELRRRREKMAEDMAAASAASAASEERRAVAEDPIAVPPQWRNWGTQVESSRIVAFEAGGGVRFYANYHLDQEGAMSCMLLSRREASVVQAARQMQRFFTIEQYRLLILARLPAAKSRYPALAKLNDQYESVAKSIRRVNSRSGSRLSSKNRRYRQQQEFLEKITDLEQATAQELARAKSELTIAKAYKEIIMKRFEDGSFKPLGGEVRFLPPFVQKRLDPAVSTISSVAERAQILSDALERTTGLLQAGVEVRLQRLNERLAVYGLIFTVLGVITTLATCGWGTPLEPLLYSAMDWISKWFKSHPQFLRPLLALLPFGSGGVA